MRKKCLSWLAIENVTGIRKWLNMSRSWDLKSQEDWQFPKKTNTIPRKLSGEFMWQQKAIHYHNASMKKLLAICIQDKILCQMNITFIGCSQSVRVNYHQTSEKKKTDISRKKKNQPTSKGVKGDPYGICYVVYSVTGLLWQVWMLLSMVKYASRMFSTIGTNDLQVMSAWEGTGPII